MKRILISLILFVSFDFSLSAQVLRLSSIIYKTDSTSKINLIEVYFKYCFLTDTIFNISESKYFKLKHKDVFFLDEIDAMNYSFTRFFFLYSRTVVEHKYESGNILACGREKWKLYRAKKNEEITFKAIAFTSRINSYENELFGIKDSIIPISSIDKIEIKVTTNSNNSKQIQRFVIPILK